MNAAYEPVITSVVQGRAGRTREIEAVIATGFLTAPPLLATELGLDFRGTSRATLADGSEVMLPSYGIAVLWDGQPRYVEADAANAIPLVGMRMLDRHNLMVEVERGGRVVIERRA